MHPVADSPGIELIPLSDPRRPAALAWLLSGGDTAGPEAELIVQRFSDQTRSQGLDVSLLLSAVRGGDIEGVGLAVQSPGRSALVTLRTRPEVDDAYYLSLCLLRAIQEHGWARGIIVLEGLLPETDFESARAYQAAGFSRLARLLYLERPSAVLLPPQEGGPKLEWVSYSEEMRRLFIQTLDSTYTETLDCPALNGVRETADVLAGHRATGLHDPSLWYVAMSDAGPAGVLLLSPLAQRALLEIVYMGVAQGFRRRGMAHALLGKAADEALARGYAGLTLAVDESNAPALHLYRRWGFSEFGRRWALICVRPR